MQGFLYLGGNECHMGIMLDLNSLPNNKAIAIVLIVTITVLGPFLYIYNFSPLAFSKYNIPTLLLLSTSCGLPIIVFNTLSIYYGLDREYSKESYWPSIGILSSIVSMIVIYTPIGYNMGKSLPITKALRFSFILQVWFTAIFSITTLYFLIKRRKTQTSNTPAAPADPLPPNPLPQTQSGT